MKDFYAILKIQHGPLRQAMQSAGIKSPMELARLVEVSPANIYDLLNFDVSPINQRTGKWRDVVLKICHFLGFSPEELFPEHLHKVIATNRFETFASGTSLPATEETKQLEPSSRIDQEELGEMLRNALEYINPKQNYILTEKYLNGKTCKEISKKLKCTRGNVSSQEHIALRRLRRYAVMNGPLKEAGCFLESA